MMFTHSRLVILTQVFASSMDWFVHSFVLVLVLTKYAYNVRYNKIKIQQILMEKNEKTSTEFLTKIEKVNNCDAMI